ncbi:MAG: site-specific integrase [Thermoplasmata archaeon]
MPSRDLLEDDDVRRWYENMARSSEATAEKNLRLLARYCRLENVNPQAIVTALQEDRKAFLDGFMDFVEAQRKGVGAKGQVRAASYLREYGVTLSSWVRHHGLEWPRGIKYGDTSATPTLQDERIPSKEQLRAIFHRASPRARAIIALMAFSGLRPQVIGNAKGTDGLRLGDVEGFTVDGEVTIQKIPVLVRVRRELSKIRKPYFTFLAEEGAEIVRAYLQSRLDAGEELTLDSPVVRVTPGYEYKGTRTDAPNSGSPFLVTGNIRLDVSKAFGKTFRQRPYVLRSYFDTNLLYVEAKIGLPRDFRVFWMGHKGDMEARYTTAKPLPPDLVEEMRTAYHRAEPYLSTVSLMGEGREIYATDVSSEKYSVLVTNQQPEWADRSDQEKLRALMIRALREDEVLRAALRDALKD